MPSVFLHPIVLFGLVIYLIGVVLSPTNISPTETVGDLCMVIGAAWFCYFFARLEDINKKYYKDMK